jgi:uncharacterized protein involved in outer membrane biogenesis
MHSNMAATIKNIPNTLVGKLATKSDNRPACHRFALAPSRLVGNLPIRLMWPLARRTPKDQ